MSIIVQQKKRLNDTRIFHYSPWLDFCFQESTTYRIVMRELQEEETLCRFFFRVWPVHFFLSIIINISLYWRPQKTKRQGNSHYHQKIAKPSILRGYSVSPNIAQSPQKNFSTLLHCSLAIMMHCLPSRTVFSSSKTSFKGFSSRHISHQKARPYSDKAFKWW